MKVIKQTEEYTIYQKRSGRYAVKGAGKMINGEEKAKIPLAEDLIKLSVAAEPEPVDEVVEEAAEEAAAEEAPAEEAAEGEEEEKAE